jgi:hypothetical protein
MNVYKMAFVSDVWTSKVVSRVIRDVLTTQRLSRLNNVLLVVAANRELSNVLKGITKVKTTTDLTECQIYRLYIDNSIERPEDSPEPETVLPDYVDEFDTIEVAPPRRKSYLNVEGDPYAGINLPYRGQSIPSTIDIYRRAPKPVPEDEPPFNPYR